MQVQHTKETNSDRRISYQIMFWLFMIGNIGGFIIEGIFCFFKYGQWESHVVTIWGPFCLIYGIGAAIFYITSVLLHNKNIFIKFIAVALIASAVELLCGLVLEFGMGMRAWNYTNHFLNIRGHISLKMFVLWGLIGIAFEYLVVRPLESLFKRIKGNKIQTIVCISLSVFMAVNMLATLGCMVRWKQRYDGMPPKTQIGKTIDRLYDDQRMAKIFIEWRFLDEAQDNVEDNQ